MMLAVADEVDPVQVAAMLRKVLDGVRDAPDTTADPVHTAYLAGVADGLDLAAGQCPESFASGHGERDTDAGESAQVDESR